MTSPRERNWLGLHVFTHNLSKQDALLTECIAPTVRELQAQGACQEWFYLRYWEGGPHVRVRFLNPDAAVEPLLRERIGAFLQAHPPEHEWTREQYYANHTFDGEPVEVEKLPWYPNGSIVSIPYEPEYKRYGGVAAMPISEGLFHSSSETAIEVLEASGDSRGKRLHVAMDLMILTALTLGVAPAGLGEYFARYAAYWQGFEAQSEAAKQRVDAMWEQNRAHLVPRLQTLLAFAAGEDEAPIYRRFVNQLGDAARQYGEEPVRTQLQSPFDEEPVDSDLRLQWVLSSIAFSQIHMLNNRLGMTPQLEYLLGQLIQRMAGEGAG